ncbi:MAG: DeoR/GlpR family DNA-binding transcription regulator [Thermodesulfobacteriota bacterium]
MTQWEREQDEQAAHADEEQAVVASGEAAGKSSSVRKRQERILAAVREKGFATIEALARAFHVTPQTIRRDINMLSREGLVHRYHGGAGLESSTENLAYSDRKILCRQEKRRIAAMVAKHIPDHASLFINIGTTTEEVARALRHHQRLRVITNNLNVAGIMAGYDTVEVIIAGGLIRHRDCGIIGEATIDFIQQFKVDFGIIGISGIDLDGTLLDFDFREVRAARAIIDNSRKTFLVADHTKFGRNAMVRLADITEIDALFTDALPPMTLREKLEAADVEYYVADQD